MARRNSSGPKGQQREALKTFAAASRSGSLKPKDQGTTAKSDTAPKAKNLAGKQKAAAQVLKAGVEGRSRTDRNAKKASDPLSRQGGTRANERGARSVSSRGGGALSRDIKAVV
jgi:hypothetical protein